MAPRLPYLRPEDLPPDQRNVIGPQNFQKVYAHSPNGARRQSAFHQYLREESPLDHRLRELAIMQAAYSANCPYAYAHHVKPAVALGMTDAEIRAVADETAGRPTALEPLAKAVLRAARELADGHAVSAETFAELQRGLDSEQLMDLLYTITCYVSMSKLLLTLQVDLEDEYQPYLQRFPFDSRGT
jgi:alkylhydroperoxidase family enzyme